MEELGGRKLRQSKAHPRLRNTSPHKVLLYLPPFGRNSNVNFFNPIRPQFGDYGGPRGSKMAPIEISSPHSYSASMHTIDLSCTVRPPADRQTTDRHSDRNRPPMQWHRRPKKVSHVIVTANADGDDSANANVVGAIAFRIIIVGSLSATMP